RPVHHGLGQHSRCDSLSPHSPLGGLLEVPKVWHRGRVETMNHSLNRLDGLRSWPALPPQPRDAGMLARDLAILAAVFLAARVVAFAAILQRGLPLVRSDGQNYIWIAESLLADGTLPTDQRQFPGFGILIAILSWVTGAHPVLSGFILVLL